MTMIVMEMTMTGVLSAAGTKVAKVMIGDDPVRTTDKALIEKAGMTVTMIIRAVPIMEAAIMEVTEEVSLTTAVIIPAMEATETVANVIEVTE